MKDLLLCKPGEIFLKGLNKHYFEERLVANVKRRLKPIGHFRVTYLQSALYIEAADRHRRKSQGYRWKSGHPSLLQKKINSVVR